MSRGREKPKPADETRREALIGLGRLLDILDDANEDRIRGMAKETWHRVTTYDDGCMGLWMEGSRRFIVADPTDPEAKRALGTEPIDLRVLMQPAGSPPIISFVLAMDSLESARDRGIEGRFWIEDSGHLTPE